jgi:hypothetical protein
MVAVISISAIFTIVLGLSGIDVTGTPAVLFLGAALPALALVTLFYDGSDEAMEASPTWEELGGKPAVLRAAAFTPSASIDQRRKSIG